MADQSSGGQVGLTLPAVTALLLVGWGIVSSATPLKSKRPSDWEGSPQQPPTGLQDVPARLWQDPLEAARVAAAARREHPAGATPPVTTQPATQATLDDRASSPLLDKRLKRLVDKLQPRDSPIALLAVSVQGQPFPEERENRIRTRHAILSGLSVLGFTPLDNSSIGYFLDPRHDDVVVPFEVFEAPKRSQADGESPKGGSVESFSDYERVIVLWLDETQFSTRRLEFLRGLECHLALIGPTGSTGLLDLLVEFADCQEKTKAQGASPSIPPPVHVFSPWATMNRNRLALLLGDRIGKKQAEEALSDLADPSNGVDFQPVIGNDKQLADLLFQELALRGACPREPGTHTVVITEWDTDYGRSWKPLLETTLKNRYGVCGNVKCGHAHGKTDATGQLQFFTYLRGLDGRLPATQGDKSKKEASKAPDPAEAEAPVGLGQVDYIRRLEKELLLLEEAWKADNAKKGDRGITAIGVLGSDLYDKLLILDALQKSFPRALFFTTDLDARYLEPRNYESVRNLLVASHFGLQLREDLQQSIPPFRDSYRTAVFLACLDALGSRDWKKNNHLDNVHPPKCLEVALRGLGEPRVFEIGRGVAYDLTGGAELSDCHVHWSRCDPNSPSPREHYWLRQRSRLFLFVGACVLFPLLLVPLSTTLQKEIQTLLRGDRRSLRHAFYWAAFCLMVYGLLKIIYWEHRSPKGEPFSWFLGISVWPTAIIRLASALVAVFYLWAGYRRLQDNKEALASEFDLPHKPATTPLPSLKGLGLKKWLRGLCDCWWAKWIMNWEIPSGQVSAEMIWARYLKLGTRPNRIFRASLFGSLYFAFFLCLFNMGDMPFWPYRGSRSFFISVLVLALSVALLIFLTAIILDCTLLCDRLLTNLRGRRIHWSPKAFEHYGVKPGQDGFVASELLKIRLAGEHTRVIASFIYYPFIVLLLMIVARHPIFDRWDFPPALIVVFAFNFLLAGTATWFLRRRAEDVRGEALDALRARSFALPKLADVDQAIDQIRSYRVGSFGHLREDPVLRAALIPFGGVGAIQLMELLSNLPAATG